MKCLFKLQIFKIEYGIQLCCSAASSLLHRHFIHNKTHFFSHSKNETIYELFHVFTCFSKKKFMILSFILFLSIYYTSDFNVLLLSRIYIFLTYFYYYSFGAWLHRNYCTDYLFTYSEQFITINIKRMFYLSSYITYIL